jgi:hypothetical protein
MPKAFGSNMCDTCFPKCFRAPNNVVKYDKKTNLNVWLKDYHLMCRAGGSLGASQKAAGKGAKRRAKASKKG